MSKNEANWISWLKKIPDWLKGFIALFTATIGLVVLIRNQFSIAILVLAVFIIIGSLFGCVYVIFAKREPNIEGGEKVLIFDKQYRFGAIVGVFLILIFLIVASFLEPVQEYVLDAFSRQLTPAERDERLLKYFENINELDLSNDSSGPTRANAQAITQLALDGLDAKGKRQLVVFLFESQFIRSDEPIIDLEDMDLTEIDLQDLEIAGNRSVVNQPDPKGINFSGADLSGADFRGADIRWAIFDDVTIDKSTEFDDEKWRLVIDLLNNKLENRILIGKDLSSSYLREAHLSNANLTGADLSNVILTSANMVCANLSGVNLTRAYLEDTNLYSADLSDAVLYVSQLIRTDFTDANLRNANLTDATIYEAIFHNAILIGTNFSHVILRQEYLDKDAFDGAYINNETQWPDGFTNVEAVEMGAIDLGDETLDNIPTCE